MIARYYRKFIDFQGNGDLPGTGSSEFGALLLKQTYSFNAEHELVANLTPASHEVGVTGYARVLKSTSEISRTRTRTGNVIKIAMSTWTFPLMTAIGTDAPRYAVFFAWSTNRLHSCWDFETPQNVTAEVLQLVPSATLGFVRGIIDPASVTP